MTEAIAKLQSEIDPGETKAIDPFVLFACGLNTSREHTAYKNALRACLKL